MFLVSKDGSMAIEVNQLEMCIEHSTRTLCEAEIIHKEEYQKGMKWTTNDHIFAEERAKKIVKEFLEEQNKICRILVNNQWYCGDYDEIQGGKVFEKIVEALENGEKIFDMRQIEEPAPNTWIDICQMEGK